jgi:diadenosine tetraphosphate (Ap4A) HIT family hydrolase
MHSDPPPTQSQDPPAARCLICDMESAGEDVIVFRDNLWACEVGPGSEVPGWLVLRSRRHAIGMPALTSAELQSFGPRARDAVAALSEATGSAATYILSFGETYPHFHALIIARGADVPPELRMGNILQLRSQRTDAAASRQLVPLVRAVHERDDAAHNLTAPYSGA